MDDILPSGLRKAELVRLMCQCCVELGLSASARIMQEESNVRETEPRVAALRDAVLRGEWDEVEDIVEQLSCLPPPARSAVRFLVVRQRYLELLEQGRAEEALVCLRERLAPLHSAPLTSNGPAELQVEGTHGTCKVQAPATVGELSGCLLCATAEELRARTGWDGASGESRRLLLEALQAHIPPSVLLPERRLQTLLQQAVLWQTSQCTVGHTRVGGSLLQDLARARDQVPRETLHVLEGHSDEVWTVQWSHDGANLASASKDATIIIWSVEAEARQRAVLRGHSGAIACVAWRPDDASLLSGGADRTLRLWEPSGRCVRCFARHTAAVSACAWLRDGRHFVSASTDKTLCLWSDDGVVLQTWTRQRVADVALSADGTRLLMACANRVTELSIGLHNGALKLSTSERVVLEEADAITAIAISADARFLLVNLASETQQEIHAWDLHETTTPIRAPCGVYRGQRQGRFIIRGGFGGANGGLLASGSEDSQVYVWERRSGELLQVLPGHSATVNAVCWSVREPHVLASCSDDGTVRIWGVRTQA